SLESRAVPVPFEGELDLTTRSLVMRAPVARRGTPPGWQPSEPHTESRGADSMLLDPVLRRLNDLRSSDPRTVGAALAEWEVSDPLVSTQICLLLAKEEHAALAHTALMR